MRPDDAVDRQQDDIDEQMDVFYERAKLRPVEFIPADPVAPGVVTYEASYDLRGNENPKPYSVALRASAKGAHAGALVEFCRNLRIWCDVLDEDDTERLTELIELIERLEPGPDDPPGEDVLRETLRLDEEDEEDEVDEGCDAPHLVLDMTDVDGDLEERALVFALDPSIRKGADHSFKGAYWAKMVVNHGKCKLKKVKGPVVKAAPKKTRWKKAPHRSCRVRGKGRSQNDYDLKGGWTPA